MVSQSLLNSRVCLEEVLRGNSSSGIEVEKCLGDGDGG